MSAADPQDAANFGQTCPGIADVFKDFASDDDIERAVEECQPLEVLAPMSTVGAFADSEMTSAIRLRRLIAEDEPLIVGYGGDEFARRLHYADRPIAPALAAVEAARATTAQILHGLTDDEWARTGPTAIRARTASKSGSRPTPFIATNTPTRSAAPSPDEASLICDRQPIGLTSS